MACFSTATSASILFLFLLFGFSVAKEFLVGGKKDAWKIPSSESDSLNRWAERSRFQVGDYLVWKYDGGKDSVLEVSKEDYDNCKTSSPKKEFSDGNTKVKLDRPGAFYFISGAKGHCEKGEKLIVVVLTPRKGWNISPTPSPSTSPSPSPSPSTSPSPSSAPSPSPSSAPSPTEFEGPAVAPSPTSTATALSGGLVMALGLFAMRLFSM